MPRRSIVRWLAPVVLIAAVAGVAWVTASTLSDPSSKSPTVEGSPAGSATHDRTPSTTKTPSSHPSRTYTVRSGDFLTTVSEKTGVSVERLRELNPGLDANGLLPGQKIRLVASTAAR
jgi:LysM repeat protein